MSHSCPSWRFMRFSLVGQLGFLDSGNFDIVSVDESQQLSYFSADAFDRIACYNFIISHSKKLFNLRKSLILNATVSST